MCKGIYLGLLLFAASQTDWTVTGEVALFTLGGLVVCLAIAAWRKLRQGYRVQGKLPAFILFLLLESPKLVYAGILLGMVMGSYAVAPREARNSLLPATVGGGAGLGIAFWLLRHVRHRWTRLGLCLLLAAGIVGGAVYWYEQHPDFFKDAPLRAVFGATLLAGIPVFYLLTFAGMAEESEVDIGAMCALLSVGMWMLLWVYPQARAAAMYVPLILYVFYSMRVLPSLRVFKHTVRGIGYANVGRYRPALLAFRRALELDPKNALARQSMWNVHRAMDLNQVAQDDETLALMDFDLCMERARSLLLEPGPSPKKQAEANHLLDLVARQRPDMQPAVRYWRAVAHTHARVYDQAAAELASVLDSSKADPNDAQRESVLLPAWQLALVLHPEMIRRVGTPQLAVPRRRMEAIAAVERRLTAEPEDATAWDLKRLLYSGLTEADYEAAATDKPAAEFDHAYVQQLGLALISDQARWQQGAGYLRMAVRGLPAQAASLYQHIAQACERAGDIEGTWRHYEMAQRVGRAVGPKNMTEEDRQIYFAIVKMLGDDARSRDDLDAAIESYQLYSDSPRSGLETLRTLAELHERKGDVFHAIHALELGLVYNAKDPDLLERKDRYYYSVMPADLQEAPEAVRKYIDADYCLRKARALFEVRDADLDLIDWAEHLAGLALVLRPESLAAKVLQARAVRRRGEIDQARALLEAVYTNKPAKFATSEDEEAWFMSCRLLGDMYLNDLGKPDLAIPCLKEFRKSSKSGADTIYKLGQAYEQVGDLARAATFYKHVTEYKSHPLAPDAREALARLQSGQPG
jgi:tetratricopeptide (TPR) repeat protein